MLSLDGRGLISDQGLARPKVARRRCGRGMTGRDKTQPKNLHVAESGGLALTSDSMLGKHNYEVEALPLGCLAMSMPLFEFSLYAVDIDVVKLKIKAFYINIDGDGSTVDNASIKMLG